MPEKKNKVIVENDSTLIKFYTSIYIKKQKKFQGTSEAIALSFFELCMLINASLFY